MRISIVTTAVAALGCRLVSCQNAAASILVSALATVTVPYSHFSDTASHTSTPTAPAVTKQISTAKPVESPVAMCDYVFTAINQESGGMKRNRRRRPAGAGSGTGSGEGTSDEGAPGGGAGSQAPIDNYLFDFSISEGKHQRYDKSLKTKVAGEVEIEVGHAEYHGNHDIGAGAVYNYLKIAWDSCGITVDGRPRIEGKEHTKISPGIVSVITSTCTVTYAC